VTGPQIGRPALPRSTRRPRWGAGAWRRLRGWATDRQWDAGHRPTGQTRGPVSGPKAEAVIPVRVTREIETVEVLGTPEQIARSGLTYPGGHGMTDEVEAPGGTPAGWKELVITAMGLLLAIESWLVWTLHKLLLAGALRPRLVLWVGALLWLAKVTS